VRTIHYRCRPDQIALDFIVANSELARKGFLICDSETALNNQLIADRWAKQNSVSLVADTSVANSRHSEQIDWRNEYAVRTLQVETHPSRHIAHMRIPPPDVNDEYINRRGVWAEALGEIKADFPKAVWFRQEM